MKGKPVRSRAPNNGGNQGQADLLFCFPSRTRLALMPKPICSPSRPTELAKLHHHSTNPTRHSTSSRSPLFKTKTRNTGSDIDEPTSPKVTCAGQIKVQPTKPRSSNVSSRPSTDTKSWISVGEEIEPTKPRLSNGSSRPSTDRKNWISDVEEIERLRKERKKKPSSWLEAAGVKKEALHIFSPFHGLRFKLGCFGSFPASTDSASDEEEEEEESVAREEEASSSQDVLSKWFMLIEQNQDIDLKEEIVQDCEEEKEEKSDMPASAVPPPNALLMMRCRPAPGKGLLNRAEELETEETRNANKAKEEEEEEEKLVALSCAPDFFKVSMDIAKETWLVGGELDLLASSRSWKR